MLKHWSIDGFARLITMATNPDSMALTVMNRHKRMLLLLLCICFCVAGFIAFDSKRLDDEIIFWQKNNPLRRTFISLTDRRKRGRLGLEIPGRRHELLNVSLDILHNRQTFVFYSQDPLLHEKINLFNMMLDFEISKLPVATDETLCRTNVTSLKQRQAGREVPIRQVSTARGYKHINWSLLTNKTRMLGTKSWFARQRNSTRKSLFSNKILGEENALQRIGMFDYKLHTGTGLTTFILSSLPKPGVNVINVRFKTPFYNCYADERLKLLGGWRNISGGMTPGLCLAHCTNDVTALIDPIDAPNYILHTEYIEYGFGKLCSRLGYPSASFEQASDYLLHSNLTADIMTALDVVHIGGIVFEDGHVMTNARQGVYPFHCSRIDFRKVRNCTEIVHAAYTKSVFVLSQDATGNYYHFTIEQLLRLTPYIDFLRMHPDIALHITQYGKGFIHRYLKIFGLKNYVVTGLTRANILFIPHGGGCHNPHLTSVQLAQSLYHDYITNVLVQTAPGWVAARNVLLLMKRHSRQLTNHQDVLSLLKQVSHTIDCDVIVFDDTALPSQDDTMRLFYRSRLITGPHGAGFSNMIFAQSGTAIIEVLCRNKIRPSIRLLAMKLGMRYHSTMTTQRDVRSARCRKEGVTVDMTELKHILLNSVSNTMFKQ